MNGNGTPPPRPSVSSRYKRPSPAPPRGRCSLSALDERREDAIRRGVLAYIKQSDDLSAAAALATTTAPTIAAAAAAATPPVVGSIWRPSIKNQPHDGRRSSSVV